MSLDVGDRCLVDGAVMLDLESCFPGLHAPRFSFLEPTLRVSRKDSEDYRSASQEAETLTERIWRLVRDRPDDVDRRR